MCILYAIICSKYAINNVMGLPATMTRNARHRSGAGKTGFLTVIH